MKVTPYEQTWEALLQSAAVKVFNQSRKVAVDLITPRGVSLEQYFHVAISRMAAKMILNFVRDALDFVPGTSFEILNS